MFSHVLRDFININKSDSSVIIMTMKQYCLRWNEHQANFISAFSSLLTCEALVDVTLAAEDNYLQAHKVVLSACSSYFQNLFTVNPCKHPIVILKDVQFADLKVVVDFMYNGEINVPQEQLPHILKIAELLKIKGLAEIALDHLATKPDNSIDNAELITAADLNWSSEGANRETSSACPLSPSRRRKRLRKSSTGSGSGSPEHPADEQQSTDSELFTNNVDDSIMKLEPDNYNSDASCDSETIYDTFHENFKEEFTDPINLEDEIGSTAMECSSDFPGPSTVSQEPSSEQGKPNSKLEIVNTPNYNLLSEKSRKQYETTYRRFKDWCERNNIKEVTETILLSYFSEKAKSKKSSSLWSEYSMMKTSFAAKHNTDIGKYKNLSAFLKRASIGYRPKKSKILTRDQFYAFLTKAPDETFLLMKVVAIIGIAGACSRDELQSMTLDDVEDISTVLVIKIPKSKTARPRSFVISGKEDELNMVDIYRKYLSLRPSHAKHKRLFVQYREGKCCIQVVGKNTFGKIPSEIAKFLDLPNAAEYTGHCFKKSSAALLEDAGGGVFSLKRPNYWLEVGNSDRQSDN